ncbi:606_t:CDS:2, partial [Entrophospora sp. SA101]
YKSDEFEKTLDLANETSGYALTGAIFAQDRSVIVKAENKLRYASGNFYINDKSTGAIVGQQPFGGARASGTNDKAGSHTLLYRFLSMRTIKENFINIEDFTYPSNLT